MQELVLKYCAEKVIDDIRNGVVFDDNLAIAFNNDPLIAIIRENVLKSDIPLLLNLVQYTSLHVGNLALGLLRPYDKEEDVKNFLLESWKKENRFPRKFKLIFRLLDDENLPMIMHYDIYSYIKSNFQDFISSIIDYYNGSENILISMEKKLSDPSFPNSKKWVRLCSAVGGSDKEGAKELLAKFVSSKEEFLAKVAVEMLEQLNNIDKIS